MILFADSLAAKLGDKTLEDKRHQHTLEKTGADTQRFVVTIFCLLLIYLIYAY